MKQKIIRSFFVLLWMGTLVGLPYLIYGECKEVYDYHTCESYTQGRITGVEQDRKYQELDVSFTDADGQDRSFSQRVYDLSVSYQPGAPVPVRYKNSQAFIDEEQTAPRLGIGLAGGVIVWIPLFRAFVYILKESVCSLFRKNAV